MARRQGDMAASMRRSLRDETARIEDRFAKADAIYGEDKPHSAKATLSREALAVPKVIRDTFSMPVGDYELLDLLKARALTMGVAINKSELIRAGLRLLSDLSESEFRAALARVDKIKPGRPKY